MVSTIRRIPWLWIVASVISITLFAVGSTIGVTVYGIAVAISLGISALQAASVLLVLRFPRWGVVVSAIAAVTMMNASQVITHAPWPIAVSSIIAMVCVLATATSRGHWVTSTASGVVVAIGAAGAATTYGAGLPTGPIVANVTVYLSLAAVSVGVGVFVRASLRTRSELESAREVSELALARREIVEERTRIAREMHDVVAHGMSVIQVQAASARYRHTDIDPVIADEFDDLAATARTALGEMRALLGVLRADQDAEQAPQPGLAELPELVSRSRAELDDQLSDEVRSKVGPVSALTVYRVVQESLSNVVRHAPGASTTVELSFETARQSDSPSGQLRLNIRNSRPSGGPAPAIDTSGHGILGMQERVAALGGALSTAPTADGGFAVVAIIPLTLEAGAT